MLALHTCRDLRIGPALADWAAETVGYRLALGVGIASFAVFVALRRRWTLILGWSLLPATVVDTIGATVMAGVWLAATATDAMILGRGAGVWLSVAPVAMTGGLVFGRRLLGYPDPRSDTNQDFAKVRDALGRFTLLDRWANGSMSVVASSEAELW